MLFHLASYGFPSWGAQSFQTARMAEAFRECGVDATLVHAASPGAIEWDRVCDVYGLRRLPIRTLLRGNAPPLVRRFQRVRMAGLRLSLARLALRAARTDAFLARHPADEPLRTLIWLKAHRLLKARVVVELHEMRHHVGAADSHVDGYVVIHERLRSFLIAGGFPAERILLAPNAVDLSRYVEAHGIDRDVLRMELGFSSAQQVICYSGLLSPSRNVDALIRAMDHLDRDTVLVLIGNYSFDHVERLKASAAARPGADVRFVGLQTAGNTLKYQIAADVLTIPYGTRTAENPKYSPVKLGEYLATGSPIVAFAIPYLKETLSDEDVVWAAEESSVALASAIRVALTRRRRTVPEIERRLGDSTWIERARRIHAFIQGLEPPAGGRTLR